MVYVNISEREGERNSSLIFLMPRLFRNLRNITGDVNRECSKVNGVKTCTTYVEVASRTTHILPKQYFALNVF